VIGRTAMVTGLVGLAVGGSAVAVAMQADGGLEKARTEEIVRAYLLEHPEVIPEAMERLQQRDLAKAVENNRAAFETPYGSAWAGAEKGDVVLVQFFDYACGFCRQSNPDIDRLLAEDKNLKVVWRELPVLGEDSVAAAEASLAAASQGKFRQFHDALFKQGRPTAVAVAAARRAAGVTAAGAPAIAQAEFQKNYRLAEAVRATGTPTFIVGSRVYQGAIGYDGLKDAIASAREAKRL
jgi:protein-disulfide isomerase